MKTVLQKENATQVHLKQQFFFYIFKFFDEQSYIRKFFFVLKLFYKQYPMSFLTPYDICVQCFKMIGYVVTALKRNKYTYMHIMISVSMDMDVYGILRSPYSGFIMNNVKVFKWKT